MKLIELSIKNFRSIKEIESFKLTSMQALLGENNAGKSNILISIEVLLSAGSGGIKPESFNDKSKEIIIKGTFNVSNPNLKKIWKPYLINDKLILEKHIWIEIDNRTGKETIKTEYHGYKSEPIDWYLSIDKIKEQKGNRPNWKEIVEENNLPNYFLQDDKCNATIYKKALEKYLKENDVEFDEPDISSTQALGLQSNVISSLPKFYLLKAITDYSDEIDKRSSNTTFRKLMGDLSDRILKQDPKYAKIEEALSTIQKLLNNEQNDSEEEDLLRLDSIGKIEDKIKNTLTQLMPNVENVKIKVTTEDIKSIFTKGVELTIDDGTETDVLLKGHGLQRCIVFSLLKTLILNERNELINENPDEINDHPIILAIEEPELYIHPQIVKLFYDVLVEFSEKHQVLYSTHSPQFIDVYEYENIALIKKAKETGTVLINCDITAFDGLIDRKIFQGLTQLNSDVNELFFAKNVIVVEGPEDKIAITETLKKQNRIKRRTEELEITILIANGASNIPFFGRVLNAFKLNYVVLHDTDIKEGISPNVLDTFTKRNEKIKGVVGENRIVTFPIKLEDTVGQEQHFKDQYYTMKFFADHNNINVELENIVNELITKLNN